MDLVGAKGGEEERKEKRLLREKQERRCPPHSSMASEVCAQPSALLLVGHLRKGSPEIHQRGGEWERETQGDTVNTPRRTNSWREGATQPSRQRDTGIAKSPPGKRSRRRRQLERSRALRECAGVGAGKLRTDGSRWAWAAGPGREGAGMRKVGLWGRKDVPLPGVWRPRPSAGRCAGRV